MRITGLLPRIKPEGIELMIDLAGCDIKNIALLTSAVRAVFDPQMLRQYPMDNHNGHNNRKKEGIEEYKLVYYALPSQITCNMQKLPNGGSACANVSIISSQEKCAEFVRALADSKVEIEASCNRHYQALLAGLADKVK